MAPFGGGPSEGPSNAPPENHHTDQPAPPPDPARFRRGYHDRTYKASSGPVGFSGWDLDRVRNAIALHDQGHFLESSLLAIVATRFGPVFAALSQAVAPVVSLPRNIKGGTEGLSGVLRDEVEAQLAPSGGLSPSPYFPSSVWGSAAILIRLLGFAVLQHVYGDPDPETLVRPVYTRLWPPWAVRYDRYRKTYVALTMDGPVDIISGDGKFTLLGDTEEPHFEGAIRALASEVMEGTLVKQARSAYVDKYGNPKWVAVMPPGTAVNSPEGDAMFEALDELQSPDGVGVLPHGATYDTAQMEGGQNDVFDSALDNVWKFVAAILLGSDGTMSPSTGVYSAPIFAGVRRDLIWRVLMCIIRGINSGHIDPFLIFNYGASIAEDEDFVQPAIEVPLPDEAKEARLKAEAERHEKFLTIIEREKKAGFVIDQSRVNLLAEHYDVRTPKLGEEKETAKAWNVQLAPTTQEKILRVDEARAALGGDPVGDDRGQLFIVELEQQAEAESKAEVAAAEADADADAEIEVEEAIDEEDDDEGGEEPAEEEPEEP